MRQHPNRLPVLTTLLLLTATPLLAQVEGVDLSEVVPQSNDETLGDFKARLRAAATTSLNEGIEVDAAKAVAAQPSATSTEAGFGTRIHNSLNNFLPIFDFAVNTISTADDEKSATVSFNPVRLGNHALNIKASIFEPEANAQLVESIVESVRTTQKETIEKGLDDFSDVEWSATFGFQNSRTSWDDKRSRMFGRDASLYQPLIRELMADVWETSLPDDPAVDLQLSDLIDEVALSEEVNLPIDDGGNVDVNRLTVGMVRQALTDRAPRYFELLREDANRFVELNQRLADAQVDQIAAMIDNQPQLTLSANLRNRGSLVGPDTQSYQLSWEMGSRNFNTALKKYKKKQQVWRAKKASGQEPGSAPTPLDAFREVAKSNYLAKNKFTLSATYQERDKYSRDYSYSESVTNPLMPEMPTEVARVASASQEKTSELCLKGQFGWAVSRQKVRLDGQEVYPRIDISLEHIDKRDDPDRQNRLVLKATYLLPLPTGLALPVTLTYADKSEFLGDPDDQLTAHLGLSYNLDRLFQPGRGD